MTEIKPGQVWADGSLRLRVVLVFPRDVRYRWEHNGVHGSRTVRDFLNAFTLIEDAPAPLDPTSDDALAASLQRLGKVWAEYRDQQVRAAAKALDTVATSIQQVVDATNAAHQPAPEPGPEPWKPGTKGVGTINGQKVGGFISEFNGVIGLYYWNDLAGHTSYTSVIPDDFTSDIVIDPVSVDWAAIRNALVAGPGVVQGPDSADAAIRIIKAGLGIEAS